MWQSGIRVLVCFEAWMAAIRATCKQSPLEFELFLIAFAAFRDIQIRLLAIAVRCVIALPPTSTILASPFALTWVNTGSAMLDGASGLALVSLGVDIGICYHTTPAIGAEK
jgi:hypothetical protein